MRNMLSMIQIVSGILYILWVVSIDCFLKFGFNDMHSHRTEEHRTAFARQEIRQALFPFRRPSLFISVKTRGQMDEREGKGMGCCRWIICGLPVYRKSESKLFFCICNKPSTFQNWKGFDWPNQNQKNYGKQTVTLNAISMRRSGLKFNDKTIKTFQ